eukprot:6208077-Pleurochrysis_carterae.AAC.3
MALSGKLRSLQVFGRAEHHVFACIETCVLFAWSLVCVQPVCAKKHLCIAQSLNFPQIEPARVESEHGTQKCCSSCVSRDMFGHVHGVISGPNNAPCKSSSCSHSITTSSKFKAAAKSLCGINAGQWQCTATSEKRCSSIGNCASKNGCHKGRFAAVR